MIDAMVRELPVIGSASGEIPVVIGDASLTFLEGGPAELANKIRSIMNAQELRDELKKKGRERVLRIIPRGS